MKLNSKWPALTAKLLIALLLLISWLGVYDSGDRLLAMERETDSLSETETSGSFSTFSMQQDPESSPLNEVAEMPVSMSVTEVTYAPDLVTQIIGEGIEYDNVVFSGSLQSAGIFTDGSVPFGIDQGIVLSTGSAAAMNSGGDYLSEGNAYDQDLAELVPQSTIYDAVSLQFDFKPTEEVINFQYVFASEEYPNYVPEPGESGSYNDVFGFFVTTDLDGNDPVKQNIAVLPNTTMPVAINNVNRYTNSNFYVANNDWTEESAFLKNNTVYDSNMGGYTIVLNAEANVNVGEWNRIKIAIADAGDSGFDSNVLIKGLSFGSGASNPGSINITSVDGQYDYLSNSYEAVAQIERSGGTDGDLRFDWRLSGNDPGEELTGSGELGEGQATVAIPFSVPAGYEQPVFELTAVTTDGELGHNTVQALDLQHYRLQVSGASNHIPDIGESLQLQATYYDASPATVTWAVYDPQQGLVSTNELASINSSGELQSLGTGTVTVVAYDSEGMHGSMEVVLLEMDQPEQPSIVIVELDTLQQLDLDGTPVFIRNEELDLQRLAWTEGNEVQFENLAPGLWYISIPYGVSPTEVIHRNQGEVIVTEGTQKVLLSVLPLNRNLDPRINLEDVVSIVQEINEGAAADFNGDGKTDRADIVELLKYMDSNYTITE